MSKFYNPKSWLQTYSGVQFWPLTPNPEDIKVEDIAHALAMQCRFGGHCLTFYSVAEHSVRMARHFEQHPVSAVAKKRGRDLQVWALLHDAGEAYLTDIPKPLKPHMPDYNRFEEEVLKAVAERFRLQWPIPDEVMLLDARMLATEQRDIMAPPPAPWNKMPDPLPDRINPWNWRDAEDRFLSTAKRLGIE